MKEKINENGRLSVRISIALRKLNIKLQNTSTAMVHSLKNQIFKNS